jgi:hypothetical protein
VRKETEERLKKEMLGNDAAAAGGAGGGDDGEEGEEAKAEKELETLMLRTGM